MITNFKISQKTKAPACCHYDCCGNHFGRIERSKFMRVHGQVNRIILTRRYAKHVERNLIRKEIQLELED